MNQQEWLYGYSSIAIAAVLFIVILICNEFSFRVGRVVQAKTDDEVKALTGAVQASILGLLALLLGFTFSMSMQRFDKRSTALIEEANAIGTAILRTELLPEARRGEARALLQEYVALRVEAGKLDLTRIAARRDYTKKLDRVQDRLYGLGIAATDDDPRAITTGAFINSLHNVIDSRGKRNALLEAHVPEPILLLLFVVFVASVGIMGYSSGLSGRRIFAPLMLVSLLVTLIVFMIIDLDRPRRGLITVDQAPLTAFLDETV